MLLFSLGFFLKQHFIVADRFLRVIPAEGMKKYYYEEICPTILF